MPERAYRNATIAGFDAAIKQTAAAEAIPYIDLFHAWSADKAYAQLPGFCAIKEDSHWG
jgi:lysophospholipase L1-like esterase